jgi:hypothetical protein
MLLAYMVGEAWSNALKRFAILVMAVNILIILTEFSRVAGFEFVGDRQHGFPRVQKWRPKTTQNRNRRASKAV